MWRSIAVMAVAAVGGCSAPPQPLPPAPNARDALVAASPPAPPAAAPVVAIDGEGLRLVDPATGRTRAIAFGRSRRDVLASLAFRGAVETGINAECGAGPLAWVRYRDGLTLQFQQDRFVGWSVDTSARVSTLSGIGPGATRAALDAAYAIDLPESTLGVEFVAGDLGGLLDGPDTAARITHMWAGVTCMFR